MSRWFARFDRETRLARGLVTAGRVGLIDEQRDTLHLGRVKAHDAVEWVTKAPK
jgi:hypothetical protein